VEYDFPYSYLQEKKSGFLALLYKGAKRMVSQACFYLSFIAPSDGNWHKLERRTV